MFLDLGVIGVEQRLAAEVGTEHLGHRVDLGDGVLERLVLSYASMPMPTKRPRRSIPLSPPLAGDRRSATALDRRFDVVPGHVTYRPADRR